jgi:signal transduction histidine kinase
MRKKPNFDEIWSESLISLSFITSSKFTEGKWPNGTDQITSINETKGIYSLALIPRKPKAYIFFIAATSIVVALILLLLLSINRSQVIRHQWNNLSADFIKLSKTGNAVDDPAHFSRLANYDLIAFRIVDNRLIANTAIHLFDPDDADHQLYQFIETTDPVPYLFLHQNTGFSQFAATMKMFVADHHAPIELIGVIDNQIIGFTISQSIPKSLESFGELQTVAQAIETLQRNMARELTQRERLADIGEAVAKINHDIRNVLSSATLVSDALLSSKDENVRKSAPLVLRSLEQAVDLCQSMLDYLAQTPDPIPSDFELPELLAEIQSASLLKLRYQGPRIMHADRNMMSRILLNLARNAGTAGANMMWVEVWQVGHLAIMDISDNGAGIPRSAWPNLFLPFKSTQGSGGGLGLAISRDLTLAQGGMLRLSRSSSDGSEFRIQFAVRVFPALSNTVEMMWHDVASPQSP